MSYSMQWYAKAKFCFLEENALKENKHVNVHMCVCLCKYYVGNIHKKIQTMEWEKVRGMRKVYWQCGSTECALTIIKSKKK